MTTITETVRARLVGAGFTGIQAVTPYGQDERVFTVNFDRHVDADLMAAFQAAGCEIHEPGENAVAVLVPAEWVAAPDVHTETTPSPTVQLNTTVDPAIARIRAEMTRLGNTIEGAHISVYHRGAECPTGDCYAVTFDSADDIKTFEGHRFTSLHRNGNRFVVVGIPADWKQVDPTPAEDLAAEPADDELAETARVIARLQRRVAELTDDKERLEQRVETLVDERDDLIEQRDSAIAMASVADDFRAERIEAAMEGQWQLRSGCIKVEFVTFDIGQSEKVRCFADKLNQGWRVAYERIEDGGKQYHARLELNDVLAPTPLPARRMLEPVPNTHVAYPPVQEFTIPPYDVPLGLTRDERVQYRVEQIKAAAADYIRAQVAGEQS